MRPNFKRRARLTPTPLVCKAKTSPLYRVIKDALRERIHRGEFKAGELAPSENQLIVEYQVSSITARRCLNDLEQEGYLQRVQGKGTFVRQRDLLKTARHIGIFYHELASLTNAFIPAVLKGIFDQVGHSRYQTELLSWQPMRKSAHPATLLLELVRQRNVDGILIISPAPLAWLSEVLAAGIPVVSVNIEYQHPRIFGVVNDATAGVERLLASCHALGHRRLVRLEEVFPETTEGVINSVELPNWKGGPLRVDHETFAYGDETAAERIIDRHLNAAEPATVFAAFGYELALVVQHLLQKRGLAIPDDISLVHLGVAPGPSIFYQVEVPAAAIGAEAARILGTLLAGHVPPDHVVRIAVKTCEGRTLGPAPTRQWHLKKEAAASISDGTELTFSAR